MNRPLFRARNLDPSKRIRLFVDQHDDNNNTLTNSSTQSASSNNLLVSLTPTSNLQTSQNSSSSTSLSTPQLPQRCVPQMPFVSGMEREEESVRIEFKTNILNYFIHIKLFLIRNIISKVLLMLKDDLVQRKSMLYQSLIYTKIKIVNLYILRILNYLNNLFVYNVYIKFLL